MYVDGFLTLGSSYPSDLPEFVPRILKSTKVPIVAPYFADADSRGSGNIYFRQTNEDSLLLRAAEDVKYVFGKHFVPEQLFIVRWDNVGFYHRHDHRHDHLVSL